MRNFLRNLFWWTFVVFAIGQIAEVFHMWVVGLLAAVAYLAIILAIVWPKKDKETGDLATAMILFVSVFAFLVLANVSTFFNLGWLQGVCILIITVIGVGCGIYDFIKFLQK